jgi:hypothetical protein
MTSGVTQREAKIEAAFMDPAQQRVFQMYVGLGPERSILKLLAVCKEAGIDTSEATLKRWSSKFKWTDLVTRTEQQISNRIAEEAMPLHVKNTQKDLDIIGQLKEKFYARVEAGEIKIDLADYVLLLKTEALIVGDPTERKEIVNTDKHTVEVHMTNEQMADFMRFDAIQKHGLPPPPKNVTPEVEHDAE